MDRVFDALIGAAAADIARHGFAYLVTGGFWIVQEKGCRLHDLPGLAIAALRDISLAPGFLNRVIACGVKAFDRRDLAVDHVGNRGDAGPHRILVDDDGACTAQRLAAAEFRAGEAELVAQIPEQRHRRIAVERPVLAVHA